MKKTITAFLILLLVLTGCASPAPTPAVLPTTIAEVTAAPEVTAAMPIQPENSPTAAPAKPTPTPQPAVTPVEVSVQNLPELQLRQMIGDGRVQHAAISPRGGLILVTSPRGVELYATDVNIIWRALKDESARGVSFDPTGQSLLVTLTDRSVILYGRSGETLTEFPAAVFNPSWSPDGTRFVASEGKCPVMQVRDAASGDLLKELFSIPCGEGPNYAQAVWGANDRIYLRVGEGFRVWDGKDYTELEPIALEADQMPGRYLSLSPDALKMAIYEPAMALGFSILDLRTGTFTAVTGTEIESDVNSVAWRSDSKALAVQYGNPELGTWIWDLNGWTPANKFPQSLKLAGYTPGGAYLYGLEQGTDILTRLNWETGASEYIMGSMIGFGDYLTWDDAGLLATYKGSMYRLNVDEGTFTLVQQVCEGCQVQSWSGGELAAFELMDAGGQKSIQAGDNRIDISAAAVNWSPDGMKFEHTLQVFDGSALQELGKLRGHASTPNYVFAWSPDGMRSVTGSEDKPGEIAWSVQDVHSGEELLRLQPLPTADAANARALAWSRDGKWIAGSMDFSATGETVGHTAVALWDAESGNLLHLIEPAGVLEITSLAFSPDGKWIAARESPDAVTVISTDDYSPRYRSVTRIFANAVIAWSPDSTSIAVTSEEVVHIYAVPAE